MIGADSKIQPFGDEPDQMPDNRAVITRGRRKTGARLLLSRRNKAVQSRDDTEHEQRIALLRTRILQEMHQRQWTRLAVVPVTKGAGGTTVCVDLAHRITRHRATRLLLVDLDLRNPAIADRLGLAGCSSLSESLYSSNNPTDGNLEPLVQCYPGQSNLSVLAPYAVEADPTELLLGRRLGQGLSQLAKGISADLVLFDMAPLLDSDSALAGLPLADAILLVADGRRTTAADMKECERLLADMPPLMGVVLNKTES